MIRTVVKPQNTDLSIKLPDDFVGKQVEVIAFTIEETVRPANQTVTHLASEKVLAKDWLSAEEDKAWQDL